MKIPGVVDPLFVSSAKRFARAFILTFIGIPLASWFGLGTHNVSGIIDAFRDQWDAAAGTALIVAIGAAGWRGILDQLPVPTLSDANRTSPPAP
jgi:hypothetical protein